MLSDEYAEFLQYNFSSNGGMPVQPLTPAIVNFVCGSCYKRSKYVDTQIPIEVTSAATGLYRRGVALDVARSLAINVSSMMAANVTWKDMLNSQPLFGGNGQHTTRTEDKMSKRITMTSDQLVNEVGVKDYTTHLVKICGKELLASNVAKSLARVKPIRYLVAGGYYSSSTNESLAARVENEDFPVWDVGMVEHALLNHQPDRHGEAQLRMCMDLAIPIDILKSMDMSELLRTVNQRTRLFVGQIYVVVLK